MVAMNLAMVYAQKIGSLHSGQSAGCEPFGAIVMVLFASLNLMVIIFIGFDPLLVLFYFSASL
jgi:hypothetical protein